MKFMQNFEQPNDYYFLVCGTSVCMEHRCIFYIVQEICVEVPPFYLQLPILQFLVPVLPFLIIKVPSASQKLRVRKQVHMLLKVAYLKSLAFLFTFGDRKLLLKFIWANEIHLKCIHKTSC